MAQLTAALSPPSTLSLPGYASRSGSTKDGNIAGIVQLSVAIAVMVTSVRSAKIAQKFGTKRTISTGALLAGVALLYTRFTVDVDTPYSLIFIGQVVYASGLGLMISPSTNSVMQSVPVSKSGIGSAMNDTTRQVGVVHWGLLYWAPS